MKIMIFTKLLFISAFLFAAPVRAQQDPPGNGPGNGTDSPQIQINGAYAFATPGHAHGGQDGHAGHGGKKQQSYGNGSVFMVVQNDGAEPDVLLRALSPQARRVELHTHKREGDVMKMRPVDAIPVPANDTVELKPMGLHIMLIELQSPLEPGMIFPLTLEFEKSGTRRVVVPVTRSGQKPQTYVNEAREDLSNHDNDRGGGQSRNGNGSVAPIDSVPYSGRPNESGYDLDKLKDAELSE